MRVLIIGGSDAGTMAALRARELSPETEVTVLVADSYPNVSVCGLPFLFSGEVRESATLAHRTKEELDATGARFHLQTRAMRIDRAAKIVHAQAPSGAEVFQYDRLIVATGARAARPAIVGIDRPGVHVMHQMTDALALLREIERARRVTLIGAGYIGLEMADALRRAGIEITLIERGPVPLATVDAELGHVVARELQANGVSIAPGVTVTSIERTDAGLLVRGSPEFEVVSDAILVATGVVPNAELARDIGVPTGVRGALRVDDRMATAVEDVWAAGDCVETWHHLLGRPTYLPLGSTAHKQGRTAGENAVGGNARYGGSLGTQVVRVFERVVGRTGLSHTEAASEGFQPLTTDVETWDHKGYFPGARKLRLRVTGDRRNGQLLGAQLLGTYGTEVSKRLDVFATAIHHRMTVPDLLQLDLSYTPPLSSPWDPVQIAAQDGERVRHIERAEK